MGSTVFADGADNWLAGEPGSSGLGAERWQLFPSSKARNKVKIHWHFMVESVNLFEKFRGFGGVGGFAGKYGLQQHSGGIQAFVFYVTKRQMPAGIIG